jgi:hypothetical protein
VRGRLVAAQLLALGSQEDVDCRKELRSLAGGEWIVWMSKSFLVEL